MNHPMKARSALIRAAEAGLRRERRRQDSALIFSICAVVIGVYLLVEFARQVAA